MANLQFENQRLRSSRKQAAERLEVLISRLQQQLENPQSLTETEEAMAHLQTVRQDDAA